MAKLPKTTANTKAVESAATGPAAQDIDVNSPAGIDATGVPQAGGSEPPATNNPESENRAGVGAYEPAPAGETSGSGSEQPLTLATYAAAHATMKDYLATTSASTSASKSGEALGSGSKSGSWFLHAETENIAERRPGRTSNSPADTSEADFVTTPLAILAILTVVGPKKGRRRAGFQFGPEPQQLDPYGLTKEQIELITTDPSLHVTIENF